MSIAFVPSHRTLFIMETTHFTIITSVFLSTQKNNNECLHNAFIYHQNIKYYPSLYTDEASCSKMRHIELYNYNTCSDSDIFSWKKVQA